MRTRENDIGITTHKRHVIVVVVVAEHTGEWAYERVRRCMYTAVMLDVVYRFKHN